jgi:hypothetical protein
LLSLSFSFNFKYKLIAAILQYDDYGLDELHDKKLIGIKMLYARSELELTPPLGQGIFLIA